MNRRANRPPYPTSRKVRATHPFAKHKHNPAGSKLARKAAERKFGHPNTG